MGAGDLSGYFNKVIELVKQEVSEAFDNAVKDFNQQRKSRIEEIYEETIKTFYSDYAPKIYKRNESLYNLLIVEVSSDGRSIYAGFDPEKMTPFRNGYSGKDGLYDQVFKKGWHGGADKIAGSKENKYGAHPNPGTPYWRFPSPTYTYWGTPAAIADTAPYDDFLLRLKLYGDGEMQSCLEECWRRHSKNIKLRW